MTTEEKARAYDKAFEKAKKKYNSKYHPSVGPSGVYLNNADLEDIFHELKESEDEKIRKALVWHLKADADFVSNGVTKTECIAYLEKQKEQEHICDSAQYEEGFKTGLEIGLRKQKEQKPSIFPPGLGKVRWNPISSVQQKPKFIPKIIRPKFAVGDTVCRPMWSDHTIREIYIDCNDPVYVCVNEEGTESHISFSEQDEWERKEQKPMEWSDNFEENIRTLLHDKLTWHSEDGRMSSTVFIDDKTLKDIISGIWFYVGKEALKYPNKELNVTGWNEEDEEIIYSLRSFLIQAQQSGGYGSIQIAQIEKCLNWLKSLRPSWKPSEEQLEALRRAVNKLAKTDIADSVRLSIMYDNLKRN